MNLHEVGRHSLVVDDELIGDAQPLEIGLRSGRERPYLAPVDAGGADDPGDQLAARERHFDGARVVYVEPFVDTDVPRQYVGRLPVDDWPEY